MNIPQSIEQLTQSGTGDPFNSPIKQPVLNSDAILDKIREKLNITGVKALDKGVAYYKISSDEKLLLKNIISLYSEVLTKALQESELDDNQKDSAISLQKDLFKNIEQLIETFFNFLSSITKKKVIDVNDISCSILGYAIETLRKNSKY